MNVYFIIHKKMLSWFQKPITQRIGFDDVLYALKLPATYVLINTLPVDMQACLIKGTLRYDIEEDTINNFLNLPSIKYPTIILYGKNSSDSTVDKKERQLIELGFRDVYIWRRDVRMAAFARNIWFI